MDEKDVFLNKKRKLGFSLLIIVAIAMIAVFLFINYDSRVYTICQAQAGSEITAADFVKSEKVKAEITDDGGYDPSVLGEYEFTVKSWIFTYHPKVEVIDTVPPVFGVKDIEAVIGQELRVEDFVTESVDATKLSFEFNEEPSTDNYGRFTVGITARDAALNETVMEVNYSIWPVVKELTVPFGTGSFDLTEVLVDEALAEAASFGLSTLDTYAAGDTVLVTTVNGFDFETLIHVADEVVISDNREVGTDEVLEAADKVLARLDLEGKSDYEKAEAIYYWVRRNVRFVNHSDHDDYIKGAWEGLHYRQGDCYVFFATSKVLLTRAGIDNVDIEKIPTRSRHYWNAINTGEGYRHFDTCPRKGGGVFFYLTDEELMSYSKAHSNSHNYDKELYPYVVE